MKKITSKKKLLLYGCSGMGVNMLTLMVGSYLCSALLVGGFDEHIESWTYLNKDLVVAGLWAVLVFVAKAFDGIIDLPFATLADKMHSKLGRRKTAIIIGFIPMVFAYLMLLCPINTEATILNTIWFGIWLCIFYAFYTLTMLTFYATFSEICESEQDTVFLSNVKSVCDVVYFILGFALVPVFVSMGINIRIVALIFLPLCLTMLIPLFMIKEKSTKDGLTQNDGELRSEKVKMLTALKYTLKNRSFVYWLCCVAVMNIGLQLFLGGISVFFSSVGEGLDMTLVMASSFVPVPFTLLLYNKIVKKKGTGFAFRYILLVYSIGMSLMMLCHVVSDGLKMPVAIGCAIIVSFAIGAFFSITYTVPSQLAADMNKELGAEITSTMYFAVQGLAEAISASLATQVILVFIRTFASSETSAGPLMTMFPLIVAAFCMIAFIMAFFLPKSISLIGKERRDGTDS